MEILRFVKGPTIDQPGCLGFEVYDGAGEDNSILVLEQWNSEESLHKHIKSHLYDRLLATMELSESQPLVYCHEVSRTWGMALIRELRTSSSTPPETENCTGDDREK